MSPIATIVFAGLVAIAGAVAVVALDSDLGDALGIITLACGLAGVTFAALRMAGGSGFPG